MSDVPSPRRKPRTSVAPRHPSADVAPAQPAAMGLSRRDLEAGKMREIYLAAVDPGRTLTDEALSASLNATLAARPKGAGWWVFAYGSLLWNPIFPIAESRTALLRMGSRMPGWACCSMGW